VSECTVAFVEQPWAAALPPSESVAIGVREVARRVVRNGTRVVVFARGGVDRVEARDEDGVEYRLVPAELDWRAMRLATPVRWLATTRRPFFSTRFFHPAYFRAVTREVRALRPDIVHVHNFSQALGPLRRASPSSRLLLQMHCDWLAALSRSMVARRLRSADLVTGCSDFVTERIRARFPELGDRVVTRLNGVDVERFRPAAARPPRTIFFAGRIAPDKGVHVLCDAFRAVRRRFPDAELVLVGPEAPVPRDMLVALSDDPLVRGLDVFYGSSGRSFIEQLHERLGDDAGAVRFVGKVPPDELPARYGDATVAVLPSLEEAFGLPLVEAMAAGLPTVASRVGGMQEIAVEGETGFLVPPGDAGALAEALERVLADAELAGRLGEAGRARAVERYSWDVITDATIALHRRLLGARGA
jgi:glycosyltransferase involved in cell wall biosynthesis